MCSSNPLSGLYLGFWYSLTSSDDYWNSGKSAILESSSRSYGIYYSGSSLIGSSVLCSSNPLSGLYLGFWYSLTSSDDYWNSGKSAILESSSRSYGIYYSGSSLIGSSFGGSSTMRVSTI